MSPRQTLRGQTREAGLSVTGLSGPPRIAHRTTIAVLASAASLLAIIAVVQLEAVWVSSQDAIRAALTVNPVQASAPAPSNRRTPMPAPDAVVLKGLRTVTTEEGVAYSRRLISLRGGVLTALLALFLSMVCSVAATYGVARRRRAMEARFAKVAEQRDAAEAENRQTAALLASLANSTPDLIWAKDRDGRMTFQNSAALAVSGKGAHEATGRPGAEFDVFPDQGQAAAEAAVYREGAVQTIYAHFEGPDRRLRHFRITMAPQRAKDGEIVGVVGQTVDVTRSYNDSTLLEIIGAASPDYIYAKDLEGRFTYVNDAMLRFAERPLAEVLGRTSEIFNLRPNEIAEYEASDREVMTQGRVLVAETSFLTQEGVLRVLLSRKFPLRAGDGAIVGLAAVSADITAAHNAKLALAESAARVEALANVMPNIIWSMRHDGEIDWVNDRWYEFTGLTRGEPEPDWAEFVHPDDRARVLAASQLSRETGAQFDIEYRMLRRDGQYRWGLVRAMPIEPSHGAPTVWMGSFTDIQDKIEIREALQAALAESRGRELQFQSILNSIPDAMVVSDNGRIVSFSAAAERMYGWTQAEIIGRKITDLLAPEQRADHRAQLAAALTEPTKTVGVRRDGSEFPAELVLGKPRLEDRSRLIAFVRDLTDRQATERRLQDLQSELTHVSRLSAMGEMAAALAHELNQPLAAGSNFLNASMRMMQVHAPDMAKVAYAMERADSQLMRAGDIIRRLREFVANGQTQHGTFDLSVLIAEAKALAMTNFKARGISLKVQLGAAAKSVVVDRIQIQQVLFNLLRNATEAMAGSEIRVLTISARRSRDGMTTISVADTGPGIDPEIAAQLFKPFATTKAEGMGIGLSVSKSIVESHGGRIWAEAAPAGGTVFRFTVPSGKDEARDRAA